jgi:uncharacterized protein (DUF1697 family)
MHYKNARKYGVHQCVIYIQSGNVFVTTEEIDAATVGLKLNKKSLKCLI